jgi:hypothetical protein
MATRIKPSTSDLHEHDFYAWSKAQADLLRAGRYSDLDLEHLIEEVDDLGESLKRSVRSRMRTIIEYLLKLEHSPAQAPRGGRYDTILTQRSDLLDELTPSIRREVEPALPQLYDRERENTAASLRKRGEHAAADALPQTCPYSLDQITGDWLPLRTPEMATRIKPPPKKLYDEDFYVWAERQAELLRAQRFDDLDLENLIEEVEGLADVKRSAVLNNARVAIEHLLKLQHSPAIDPRASWRESVREHRSRLEIDLTPRLRQILANELAKVYALGRRNTEAALRDHGEDAAADALPATCPYSFDQITGDWLP